MEVMARFAMLKTPRPTQRFITNDKGYVPLHEIARDLRGVVFPLAGTLAGVHRQVYSRHVQRIQPCGGAPVSAGSQNADNRMTDRNGRRFCRDQVFLNNRPAT
jgi:hypothetical protein